MLRRWLAGGLMVGLLASAVLAKPGVVTNKQGDTFTGEVTEDENTVSVKGPGGTLTFNKSNIAKIEYSQSIDEQYESRHAKLKSDDVRGRIALAAWANDQKRADLAVRSLEEARKIDPTNNDAARALDSAQHQLELDQAGAQPTAPKPAATNPSDTTAANPGTPQTPATPATPAAAVKPLAGRRLLNADEINIIRQKEMSEDDKKIRVRFDNEVVKKYLATGDRDKKAFAAKSAVGQAFEILGSGDPDLAKDVRIVTDPTPLLEFKTKVLPVIAHGCGSTACHGGPNAGSLQLFPGESQPAVYTNFYILTNYSAKVDNTSYLVLDRENPKRSLALQFGLPMAVGTPPHPKAANWRPRFQNDQEPAFVDVLNWLSNSVKPIQPDYGISVSVRLSKPGAGAGAANGAAGPGASTKPASATKPVPATKPAP